MIQLLGIELRHERRLRLSFTSPLAAAAFGTPGPSCYVIENIDGSAINPSVVSALIVAGSPAVVELAISTPLTEGALYRVTAVGVPAQDLSVTPAGTEENICYGNRPTTNHIEPTLRDRSRLLYQTDLIFNGTDFQETANGDLARVSGTANVTKALWHSVETQGLPWDRSWGVRSRDYVDSPSAASAPLLGALSAQLIKDRRVETVRAKIEVRGSETYITLFPSLVGGDSLDPVSVTVPNS